MEVVDRINRAIKMATGAIDLIASGDARAAAITLKEQIQSLREELFTAREDALALKDQMAEMSRKLRRADEFDAERDRYVLQRLSTGSVVYAPKGVGSVDQPGAYLCAHCFERSEKSYLQPSKMEAYKDTYTCHACGSFVFVPNNIKFEAFVFSSSRRDGFDGY